MNPQNVKHNPKPAEELEPTTFEGLSDDQVKALQEVLEKLIEHIAPRIHYAESRRSVLAAVGGALFAASIALITLALTQVHYLPLRIALVVFSVSGIALAATIWFLYARQTNFHYPFLEVKGSWKWFYRDALADLRPYRVPLHSMLTNEAVRTGRNAFTSQWREFKKRQVEGLSDLRNSTLEDLRQLYVLHVNERYKNLFLSHLRTVLNYGLFSAILLAAVGFLVGTSLHNSRIVLGSGVFANGDITIEASWRDTGAVRAVGIGSEEVQLLVNIRVRNQGKAHFGTSLLAAIDNDGMQIPAFQEYLSPSPLEADAGSKSKAVAIIWIPKSLRNDLHHFEVAP